ncbi:MAG: hypothetical protein AB7T10_00545 [bacterium]
MKKIYLLSTIVLFLASCSIGPVPIYTDQPIVKIIEDTFEITFSVPDTDADGWENYNWMDIGADTYYLSTEATEIKEKNAYIYRIDYSLIVDNNEIEDGSYEFQIPLEITESDTIDIQPSLEIIVAENTAYDIDVSDGVHDNVGRGILEVQVRYTDEMGDEYSSLPVRKPFLLVKP